MNKEEILIKAAKVISSCKTQEQLITASVYVDLVDDIFKDQNLYNKLNDSIQEQLNLFN